MHIISTWLTFFFLFKRTHHLYLLRTHHQIVKSGHLHLHLPVAAPSFSSIPSSSSMDEEESTGSLTFFFLSGIFSSSSLLFPASILTADCSKFMKSQCFRSIEQKLEAVSLGDLEAARVTAAYKIRLWNKDVDSESFHPYYRRQEMRFRLTNGEPEKPLVIHVGRLGV